MPSLISYRTISSFISSRVSKAEIPKKTKAKKIGMALFINMKHNNIFLARKSTENKSSNNSQTKLNKKNNKTFSNRSILFYFFNILTRVIANIHLRKSFKHEHFYIIIFSGYFFWFSVLFYIKLKFTHFRKNLNEWLNLEEKNMGTKF